jgi:hypothetical protein
VFVYSWEDNNSETFDITLQGSVVARGHVSGSAGHWEKLGPWVTNITNGTLAVSAAGGDANLSGIEVWRMSVATRTRPLVNDLLKPVHFSIRLFANGMGGKRFLQSIPSSTMVTIATIDGRVLIRSRASELMNQKALVSTKNLLVARLQ